VSRDMPADLQLDGHKELGPSQVSICSNRFKCTAAGTMLEDAGFGGFLI